MSNDSHRPVLFSILPALFGSMLTSVFLLAAGSAAGCSSVETVPGDDSADTAPAPPTTSDASPLPTTEADSAPRDAGTKADSAWTPPPSLPGTATVRSSGILGPYTPRDALAVVTKRPSTSQPGMFVEEIEIYIVDRAGLCPYMQRNERPAGVGRLKIEIEKRGTTQTAAKIAAGTYPLYSKYAPPAGMESDLEGTIYQANDAGTCSSGKLLNTTGLLPADLVKNELVLTSVGPTGVKGTFEMRFKGGQFLSGTFDAPVCDTSGAPTGNTQCK